ncbi:ABC transporter ATP-binding protein [Frigidibacter sp. ROC022]|uniref:ABC transporter ATP-binding protein n=1 Tax=Frigidibacter sp. ROC022 TaxID=2971796 RepID=UPI00215AD5CE|nr:ABC transporter ATP-binding protein [Frigidibacter sp. ROC022]MCR8725413.1 ABC transporter ATP-binding protein [Frigidibacter sp. ROC022]
MEQNPSPVVDIDHLSLNFQTYRGAVQALDDVSLQVRPGEIVGLVGESGCGKSVLAMSTIRLLPPQGVEVPSGRISVLGRDILASSEAEMGDFRGHQASMVFQEPMNALNPTIRVGRQIVQVIRRHESVSQEQATARAVELLREMQVSDAERIMRNYPFELSGGMRQRVLLAMAFSCNPRVLIADEPTTALDVTVQAQVLALLRTRASERGVSVLFITHDLAVVAQLCDRVYVMYAGKMVEEGSTRDVLKAPRHPYTRALLRSLPEFAEPLHPLASIPGTVPNLIAPPGGCRFRPRCAHAFDKCLKQPPLEPGPDHPEHKVACWLPEGTADAAQADTAEPETRRQTGETLMRLDQVSVRFDVGTNWLGKPRGQVHAMTDVTLDIRRGETIGIVGESGCGKSTLAQVAMALRKPSSGKVQFDGQDLSAVEASAERQLRQRFQIVFQDPQSSLDPRMPVWSLISEPLAVRERHPRSWLKARAGELAETVGIRADQLDRYAHEFSGGQRQRIAIARALALSPDLLVLDEPTSALDVSVQAQILNLLMELQRNLGLTYLFVSHNVSVIRHIADRVAVMYLGEIVELGTAAEVLDDPVHYYTRSLIASVPRLDGDARTGAAAGFTELPSNLSLPKGCFFADRCPARTGGCEKRQVLAPAGAGADRLVRCHLAQG